MADDQPYNRIRATVLWLGTWSLNFLITGAKHTYLQLLVEARLELTLLLIKPSLLSCVNKVALFLCKLVFFLHNLLQKRKKFVSKQGHPQPHFHKRPGYQAHKCEMVYWWLLLQLLWIRCSLCMSPSLWPLDGTGL